MPSTAHTLSKSAIAKVGKGYDLIANIYDGAVRVVFGQSLAQLQHDAIERLHKAAHISIIGGGSGTILRQLMDKDAAQHYAYIEASMRMLDKAKARLTSHETLRVDFTATIPEDLTTDIIILPFVLDCYPSEEVKAMLTACSTHLRAGGKLLVIDFNLDKDHGFQGSWYHRAFIRLLYGFFRITGGSRTTSLPPVFSLANDLFGKGIPIASRYQQWILASVYQAESKKLQAA